MNGVAISAVLLALLSIAFHMTPCDQSIGSVSKDSTEPVRMARNMSSTPNGAIAVELGEGVAGEPSY